MRRFDTCLELANKSLGFSQTVEVHFQGVHAHDPAAGCRFLRDINEHGYLL
jgi:hypothetical protein